jgi:hypothetical protein
MLPISLYSNIVFGHGSNKVLLKGFRSYVNCLLEAVDGTQFFLVAEDTFFPQQKWVI